MKNSRIEKIPFLIRIERAKIEKLIILGKIDPERRKSGLTEVVNEGLQFVIDNEVTWGNHVRRKKEMDKQSH